MRKVTFGRSKFHLPISARCLYCGHGPLDAACCMTFHSPEVKVEPGQDIAPEAGCVTMCGKCGAIMVFAPGVDGKLGVRAAGQQDLADLQSDAETWKLIGYLRKHARRRWRKS